MIEQINFAIFHLINQYAGLNPLIDSLAVITANYMPMIIILGFVYIWFKNVNRSRNIVLFGVYAAILGLVINYIIGLVYFHPRPFMIPLGTLLFQYPAETSFPSDHATLMFSLALMLIYFKETRIAGVIFLILGFIGSLARIFSGVHFPLDVLGSVFVSIISTIIVFQFKDKFNTFNTEINTIYSKITK